MHTPTHTARENVSTGAATPRPVPIHRLPIVWVAAALFAASIAGCIVTIALALGQPDAALPDVGERLLSVPAMPAEDRR